jgi:hypothetical protein
MATLYGVNATKRDVNVPADKIGKGEVNGRVLFAYDEYTSTGAIAINDVINVMKLPAKARVISTVLSSTDLGTVGTLTVGWAANGVDAADDDGLLTTVDVNAAAIKVGDIEQVPQAGTFKQFGAETQIQIKATAATDAAGTIKIGIMYVVD